MSAYLFIVFSLCVCNCTELVSVDFYLGRFEECLYLDFHGQWQHERMTIQYVEPQDPRALLELHGQVQNVFPERIQKQAC